MAVPDPERNRDVLLDASQQESMNNDSNNRI